MDILESRELMKHQCANCGGYNMVYAQQAQYSDDKAEIIDYVCCSDCCKHTKFTHTLTKEDICE